MAIEKREIQVAKEIDDILVLIVSIVEDIRAGKSAGEIASGNLPKLISAIENADQATDEFAKNRKAALGTVGLRTGYLTDALLGK